MTCDLTGELLSGLAIERYAPDVVGNSAQRHHQLGHIGVIAEAIWNWLAVAVSAEQIKISYQKIIISVIHYRNYAQNNLRNAELSSSSKSLLFFSPVYLILEDISMSLFTSAKRKIQPLCLAINTFKYPVI